MNPNINPRRGETLFLLNYPSQVTHIEPTSPLEEEDAPLALTLVIELVDILLHLLPDYKVQYSLASQDESAPVIEGPTERGISCMDEEEELLP